MMRSKAAAVQFLNKQIVQRITENVKVPFMHQVRTGHVRCLTIEEWTRRDYEANNLQRI